MIVAVIVGLRLLVAIELAVEVPLADVPDGRHLLTAASDQTSTRCKSFRLLSR